MPFKERTKQWALRVADGRCQYEMYSEKRGFYQCDRPATDCHHIVPEGTLLAEGKDSEHCIVPMPLCQQHHTRNLGDEEYSEDFSFHPDAGQAYKDYRNWKQENLHMQAITGKISGKIPRQSPFEDMVDEHHKKQKLDERYHAGTPELDDYYIEKMRNKATVYQAEHPHDKKPETKPNPRFDPSKKKHWYDNTF